jgi:conjugative relaxase-like TrwC/TraI family protein
VLCIAKVRPGGHTYYLEVVETGAESPGQWLGERTERLGLRGVLGPSELEAVLTGADPFSGNRIGRSHDRVKVAGFDLTFCAPKSVSLLHALGEPDVAAEVRSGHETAVCEAFSYVERRSLAVRRGSGQERAVLAVDAVAAGGFVHRISRALDPHLHTHVVLANLGRSEDGTWSALDGRGVYAHAATTSALYHAQLRHELTERLGVAWEPLNRGRADIAGIGREVRRAFSQRAVEIEANLHERARADPAGALGGRGPYSRPPSHRARSVAAFATRAPRDPTLAPESLRGWWQERARDVGLSPRLLEAALDRLPRHIDRRSGLGREDLSARRLENEVEGILGGLGRSVTRRDVTRAWCSVLESGAPVKDVERAADGHLSRLEALEGWRGDRDGPGVAERRHVVGERDLERGQLTERHRMDRHLAERGMSRLDARNQGLARDSGLELGL